MKLPTPPEGADDQRSLARLEERLVTNRLDSGDCGYRYGSGVFEAELAGLVRDLVHLGSHVLGEGTGAGAVDGVARLELADVGTSFDDGAGEGASGIERLGPSDAGDGADRKAELLSIAI
jgi:hypothetical protein